MKLNNKGIALTAFALATMPNAWAQKTSTPDKKPVNIVLFVADDLGVNDIGPYGNRVVRTPNLDRLASESLVFSNAFASSPTCAPSRASIHTGLYPFRNGAHVNHSGIREGIQTLPVCLQSLGYKVAIAGKLHVGPGRFYPFEMIHNTNVSEPGHEKDGVLWTDLNMEPVDQWLAEASANKSRFMLVVNDHSPHVIWPEKAEYDYTKVDVPSIHIDTEATRKSRARYYTDITKMDGNVGKLLKSLEKYNLDENTVVIFTADQGPQWAFGKWNLYDYGIRVPLLVKWPGTVKGGTETNALVSLVDLLPTAAELAGGLPAKNLQDIDGKSLLPILTGKKSSVHEAIFASHTGDGKVNQAPMRMIRTNRYKYIRNLAPEQLYTNHIDIAKDHDGGRQYWPSWVAESYKSEHAASVLWRYHNRPDEELYDVLQDPNELHNLAADPAYESIMLGFRAQMTQWREQQGDKETGIYQNESKGEVIPYIFK
jgi:arylsulfatase A-like enzyme